MTEQDTAKRLKQLARQIKGMLPPKSYLEQPPRWVSWIGFVVILAAAAEIITAILRH
jgi:hypothetical protein